MSILQREAELDELVRLVGMDALPQSDRLLLQAAKMIREDFLHQNAFDDRDTYTSMEKQFKMLDLILTYFNEARPALEAGALLNSLLSLKVLEDIARAKLIEENALHQFDAIKDKLTREIAALPR